MILENIMEEKQLNFNQPLLSVRRFSSSVATETDYKTRSDSSLATLPPFPGFKSELKSGPVRNPGTVPFVWEKTPGRPKDQSKLQIQTVERPPITPNLPPGRVLKVKQQDSDIVLKGTSVTETRTGSTVSNSQNVASFDKKVTKHESLKEEIQEKASSDSDDGDEAYLDALDTLSRTESFFMSCSVSGLSGLDDQGVQPPGNFSTDQQARDFMIDRFLPAAKAMTSETPQYASRKPLVGQEQPRQVKKVVSAERSRPLNQHRLKFLPHYVQDIGRKGSKDESGDYNGSGNKATTVCGLFPRFCLLNPIPGLRMEDKVLSSAVHGMQAKSVASQCETAKEHARTAYYGEKSVDSQSGFTEEKDFLGIPEKYKHGIDPHPRGCSKLLACESTHSESSCESPIVEKTLYVDSVPKVKSHSNSYSSEMKGQANHRGDDFDTLRKDSGIYKNPSIDSSFEDSKYLGVVDERATLQPKSSESLDSPFLVCSENSSNDMQMEMTNHSKKVDLEKQGLTKPGNQGSDLNEDLNMISSPKVVECNKIDSESQVSSSQKSSDSLIQNPVSWKKLKLAGDLEVDLKRQRATKSVDQKCTHGSTQDPSALARSNSKVGGDGKIDLESQCLMKLGHQETSDASYLQLPLVLPLLKAPSESWLKRTLPTISSRNISSRSKLAANINARSQTPKTASLYPKWETIVKSSNVHHGHLRFSEELLTSIPEA